MLIQEYAAYKIWESNVKELESKTRTDAGTIVPKVARFRNLLAIFANLLR